MRQRGALKSSRACRKLVADLFNRNTELPAALRLRACSWSPTEYIGLLEGAVGHQRSNPLHRDTMRVLQQPLHSFRDVLQRQVGLDLLKQLGPLDKFELFRLYSEADEFEQAARLVSFNASEMSPEKAELLLHAGALHELTELVGNGYVPSEQVWCRLVEATVRQRLTRLARIAWSRRPTSSQSQNLLLPTGNSSALSRVVTDELIGVLETDDAVGLLQKLAHERKQPFSSALIRGLAHVLAPQPLHEIVDALDVMEGRVAVADLQPLYQSMETNVREILGSSKIGTLAGNVLLRSLYESHSSQLVFHVHRLLVTNSAFVGDITTAQVLANGALRLRNSKLVSYAIWKEYISSGSVQPTRKLCETMLQCQISGSGYRSVLYYLKEMRQRGIFLREHVKDHLVKRFAEANDPLLAGLFSDLSVLEGDQVFDLDLAKRESKPLTQALNNERIYREGRPGGLLALDSMLSHPRERKPERRDTLGLAEV